MSTTEFDVIVVGAGPVGLMAARELGRLGHTVGILERWPTPYPLPRAVAYDFEIGRFFAKSGIGNDVKAISQPVTDHYTWVNADREPLVKVDWSQVGPSGWPVTSMFSQPELENAMRAALPEVPNVSLEFGREVVAIDEDADGVTLTVCEREDFGALPDDAPTATYRAQYVIGCDGANSFVRAHMGIDNHDLGFFFDWLICDVIPQDDYTWTPTNWQLCDPKRPTTMVSGGPGRRRWEFMLLPGETAEQMNREQVAWDLLKVWDRTPENSVLERHAVYRFQARWAKSWREGRLMLAGDAAHLMPPFAGQGMCSGIRDAMNLTWKLDLVLRGKADDAVLDSYTTERITHLRNAIEWSIALGNVICILDEEKARERDERMIAGDADPAKVMPAPAPPILGDGISDVSMGAQELARMTSPQFTLVIDGKEQPQDEALGSGWTVFTRDGVVSGLSDDARAALALIDATVVSTDGSDTGDGVVQAKLTGPFGGLMDGAGIDVLVIRPDFYVYGSATKNSADRLIAGIASQLQPAGASS